LAANVNACPLFLGTFLIRWLGLVLLLLLPFIVEVIVVLGLYELLQRYAWDNRFVVVWV
jgi:hypothetical protein